MGGFVDSFIEMFRHGGPILIPLLIASVLGLAIILDRAIVFLLSYENYARLIRKLQPVVLARKWSEAERLCQGRGPLSRLTRVYLQFRDRDEKLRESVLSREGSYILAKLETRLRALAALAQISTLLGLLGTFYFLIVRLTPAATARGEIQQAEFVTAIWESFLSTMIGLAIAIPCMIVYQFCEGHVDAVGRQLMGLVSHLDEWRANHSATASEPSSNGDQGARRPAAAGRTP